MSSRSKTRKRLAPSPVPTSAPRRKPIRQAIVAFCLIAGLAAAGYNLWDWHQSSRPGMAHYLKGMDYASEHQIEQAKKEWLQGIQEDPKFPQCWVQLGDFYAQAHQYPQATRCYQEASKLLPGDGDVFLHLAQMEQALGDTQGAAAAAGRATVLYPNDGQAQALLGNLEGALNNRPLGLAAMRRAHQLLPDAPDIVHELTRQEINAHDSVGAERDLAAYAQAHPQDAEADYLMALIATEKPPTPENLRAGLDYAQRAYAVQPQDLRIIGILGQLYLNAGQPAQALPIYLAGNRIDPSSEDMMRGLVTSYTRLGRMKEADSQAAELRQASLRHEEITRLIFVVKANPQDIPSGLRLAQLQEADGELHPAQFEYERLVRHCPHDPRTHPALASFLRRVGRPDLAAQAERPDFVP